MTGVKITVDLLPVVVRLQKPPSLKFMLKVEKFGVRLCLLSKFY